VGFRGRCGVDGTLQFRDKGVKDRSGGGVAEEGCVEEVSSFDNNVWILLLYQRIESIGGAKVLNNKRVSREHGEK
jgi:hypothetical protein